MAATEYTIRKKVFTLFGAKFHIYNSQGDLIGYCKQKAFKLKEDIRIFTDESMTEERMTIAARSIIDFSAAYDVTDSSTQQRLGALQRKGMKSLLRDEWTVLDDNDNEVGTIKEDSMLLALFRRYLMNLIPQKYHLSDHSGHQHAEFRSHFNPFIQKMTVTVYPDAPIHPLLILAAGVLLVAIEGRQQ
jgi:uncharacterized protein YxjI